MKRAFDSQEGSCHVGERLRQLLCLEMKKMKSQLNNELWVHEGPFWGRWRPPVQALDRKKNQAFVAERSERASGKALDNNIPCCGQMTEGTSWPEGLRRSMWPMTPGRSFIHFTTVIWCLDTILRVKDPSSFASWLGRHDCCFVEWDQVPQLPWTQCPRQPHVY